MVVSASTNQVWTKITIGSHARVFCHSESDTSGVAHGSWNFRHVVLPNNLAQMVLKSWLISELLEFNVISIKHHMFSRSNICCKLRESEVSAKTGVSNSISIWLIFFWRSINSRQMLKEWELVVIGLVNLYELCWLDPILAWFCDY